MNNEELAIRFACALISSGHANIHDGTSTGLYMHVRALLEGL